MKTRGQVQQVLRENDIYAKKSLGQNFLICDWVYDVITETAKAGISDTIIEVGPGPGVLTEKLTQTGKKVIAIEKDNRMIENLNSLTLKYPNLNIIEDDILETDIQKIVGDRPYQVIGNIPYYLTSHLIRQIFESWPKPESVLFMIQKEVAQRITAKTPDMSLLAISVTYFATAKVLKNVGKNCFKPAPKVDSALILMTLHKDQKPKEYEVEFFKVAKAGFSEKRKQLINNLSSGLKQSKETMLQILESANIDPKRRAETLTLEEWHHLTKFYSQSLSAPS